MQRRILISGVVQGVGFRYCVLDNAKELGITGWVRNTKDNKVEALLQGKPEDTNELILRCRQGPAFAKVTGIEEFSTIETKFEDFIIRKS